MIEGISERFYKAAELRAMSQTDVSDASGISQGAISRILAADGDSNPQIKTLTRIAEALRVRPQCLTFGEGAMVEGEEPEAEAEPEEQAQPEPKDEAREILLRQLRRLDEQAETYAGMDQAVIAEALVSLYTALEQMSVGEIREQSSQSRNREIVRLAKAGMEKREIAKRFGISCQRVYQIIGRCEDRANSGQTADSGEP